MKAKKFVTMLLVLAMLVASLAGCSSPAAEGGETAAPAAEKVKIGACFYSNTDSLGTQTVGLVNAAADALGVEMMWEIGNFDSDSLFAAVQNLISAGCKGIIYQPVGNQTFVSKIIDECEANGVYLCIQFSYISDKETYDHLCKSPYYIGMVHQTERENIEKLMDILHADGRDNIGVGYATPGSWISENRNGGIDGKLESNGMKKLGEYTNASDNNVMNVTSAVQNFLTSYPDMNGIVCASASGGVGEAITQLLANSSVDCAFAGVDTFEGMAEAFENGYCVGVAGGTAPNGIYAFALTYNAVTGNPLSDKPIVLAQPALIVSSADEARTYDEKVSDVEVLSKQIFTEDYFKSLSKQNNPELTVESLQSMMNEWSFDWVNAQLAA